jgi:hypothetical protein
LHALLYTGHSQALSGRPVDALATYQRYDVELDRRQVPRYRGRGANFTGWIRRSLGQWERADDENLRALDELGTEDFPETVVAAHSDLASSHLLNNRVDDARSAIANAEAALGSNLTFGWRLGLRTRLLRARLHLLEGEPELAREIAAGVIREAAAIGVPRYVDEAQLHLLHAESLLSSSDDVSASAVPLIARLPSTVGIDAWWLLAGLASALGVDSLHHEVDRLVLTLQRSSGDEGTALPVALERLRRRRT